MAKEKSFGERIGELVDRFKDEPFTGELKDYFRGIQKSHKKILAVEKERKRLDDIKKRCEDNKTRRLTTREKAFLNNIITEKRDV